MNNLVSTLAKAGLLEKPSDDKGVVNFKWNRIQDCRKVQLPEMPSSKLTKPKQRIIVSQRYAGAGKQERPDGISSDRCDICKIPLLAESVEVHKSDELHVLRLTYRKNRKNFDDTKHILAVKNLGNETDEAQSGIPLQISCRVGMICDINLEFTNMLDSKEITVEKILPLISHKDVLAVNCHLPTTVHPGKKFTVELKALFSARCAVLYPLVLNLKQSGTDKTKPYLADIEIRVQSELMDALAPSVPFSRPLGPIVRLQEAPVLPGRPADMKTHDLELTSPLKSIHFDIPPILVRFLNTGFKPHPSMSEFEREKLQEIRALLPSRSRGSGNWLNACNYVQLLELLLFIEEHQMSRDIHHYDMHSAVLHKNKEGLWLNVPGVIDKRPSLLLNDVVIVNFANDQSISYEGYVLKIVGSRLLLGLHHRFEDQYTDQKLEVRFKINRAVLKSMHRALYLLSQHHAQGLMFPSLESSPTHQRPLRPWFNHDIKSNPEQQAAVRNIVHNSSQNSPYLVFGPPGTGKTVTLVETILQLWDPVQKSTRILVCAPSNAAADEITSRLLKTIESAKLLKKEQVKFHIFRLCAMSRTLDAMPLAIRAAEITNHDPRTGSVYFPRLHVIMSYDIVISTFSNISRLFLAQMPPGHFTHIIMDEVGQALETEALIPLAGLAITSYPKQFCCQVVMAGDPKQLGPIIQSPVAAEFGFNQSMLERLMSLPLYSKKPSTNRYDPNVLTKLVLNYRSHPAILKVSNDLFYDGELKPVGDKSVIESVCHWEGLCRKDFPLIFHGVEGIDEREGTSPSFFNRQEVEIVTDYIKKIHSEKLADWKEIGVVTPYNMQVKKIRKACEMLKMPNIDVASVEQFQGQERKVIIISTVRSRFQFLEFDYLFQLGFLRNPKRFNVAVTRARSLLVVVGNPKVLQHDTCWRSLLEHCLNNGAYTGMPFKLEALQDTKIQSVPARFL
ncbi:hypothetical protein ONE63_000814 [Megalurothrips usitatus]|uniref:RNA helicase n=1 Tax=Megalurothrips usitatus TaxID=439358 RepID=A0AAV7Y4K4_9NEOP|nr:hypothetical protein ONE63_000814 [Megalurothrips usitatus]